MNSRHKFPSNIIILFISFCALSLSLFSFPGPHLWYMEVYSPAVESEMQLLAYAIATAMPDPSHICKLCCSLRQHWILEMEPTSSWLLCQVFNPLTHKGNSHFFLKRNNSVIFLTSLNIQLYTFLKNHEPRTLSWRSGNESD